MLLSSVGKRYARGRWVLTEIDLDIASGQIVAITGSNGTGKSTLLNIMAGITRPTTGTVTGRPRSIGYVPERFPVRTQLSAVAYLRHMGRIRGVSTDAATRRASSLMDRFELSEGDTALRQLSKGNAQRVGLIQALLVPPELLILDEPATGLDELGHGVLTQLVEEVAREGARSCWATRCAPARRRRRRSTNCAVGGSRRPHEAPSRQTMRRCGSSSAVGRHAVDLGEQTLPP